MFLSLENMRKTAWLLLEKKPYLTYIASKKRSYIQFWEPPSQTGKIRLKPWRTVLEYALLKGSCCPIPNDSDNLDSYLYFCYLLFNDSSHLCPDCLSAVHFLLFLTALICTFMYLQASTWQHQRAYPKQRSIYRNCPFPFFLDQPASKCYPPALSGN